MYRSGYDHHAEEILSFQQLVRMTPIGESVARHAVDLVRATRQRDQAPPTRQEST